jgi:methyltransferase family protein
MAIYDVERADDWLAGLWRLNAAIAATGQPLYGNLCYDDLQDDYLTRPPNQATRPKRDRLRAAIAERTRLLEVGVNGGHSAYVALSANPKLSFHGVDICEHTYVRPVIEVLKEQFPGRVSFSAGNSLRILPGLAKSTERFDAFHIDGAKHFYFKDILNCARLIDGDSGSLIVDDTQLRSIAWVWRTSVRHGLIRPDPENPPGPAGAHDQSGSGTLLALPWWRWSLLERFHANLPPLVASIRDRPGGK